MFYTAQSHNSQLYIIVARELFAEPRIIRHYPSVLDVQLSPQLFDCARPYFHQFTSFRSLLIGVGVLLQLVWYILFSKLFLENLSAERL